MTRSRRLALDALTALLAVAGMVMVVVGGSPPPEERAVTGPPGPTAPAVPTGPAALARSVPVHLDIPAIGVSTALITLGLNPDGTIAVPPLRRGAPAGWYQGLASPGEVGPAVILGHVDTARDGPAVFHQVKNLRPGDRISVRRQDGRTAVFAVNRVAEYPKSTFPTDAVYGGLDHPALRLVTCGGSFDKIRKTYRGNVIAYADLVA